MSIYCVYITFYRGNKLPPFYIGYSTVKNVENGYHGSVVSEKYQTIWKEELKNNPQLFKTVILSTYNSILEAKEREEYIQRFFNVHKNPMFINLSISGKLYGAKENHSEETKKKISNKRKGMKFSKEHRENISKNSRKHQTPETKEKIRVAGLGRKWTPETLKKMSISAKKRLPNSKEYIIITPQNEEITIKNLAKFCRENNLTPSAMHHILDGSQKTHRGYSIRRS